MKKNAKKLLKKFSIAIFTYVITLIIFYQFYPQYKKEEVVYMEGILESVTFVPTGKGGNFVIKLDTGPSCFVSDGEIGNKLKSDIGRFASVGYTTAPANIRHSSYYVIDLHIENTNYISVHDVNKANFVGYFFIAFLTIFFFIISNLEDFSEIFQRHQQNKKRRNKRKQKANQAKRTEQNRY